MAGKPQSKAEAHQRTKDQLQELRLKLREVVDSTDLPVVKASLLVVDLHLIQIELELLKYQAVLR